MFDYSTKKIETAKSTNEVTAALEEYFEGCGKKLDESATFEEELEYLEQFSGASVEFRCKALRAAIKRRWELEDSCGNA